MSDRETRAFNSLLRGPHLIVLLLPLFERLKVAQIPNKTRVLQPRLESTARRRGLPESGTHNFQLLLRRLSKRETFFTPSWTGPISTQIISRPIPGRLRKTSATSPFSHFKSATINLASAPRAAGGDGSESECHSR